MANRRRVAVGAFEVEIVPLGKPKSHDGVAIGRMSLSKEFHGDLEGRSRGQMLTATTPVEGSAGYVAIERFEGALAGRTGTLVLQHSGAMTRGEPALALAVVADSGTAALTGLEGTMKIIIDQSGHRYEFRYSLPAPHPGT